MDLILLSVAYYQILYFMLAIKVMSKYFKAFELKNYNKDKESSG